MDCGTEITELCDLHPQSFAPRDTSLPLDVGPLISLVENVMHSFVLLTHRTRYDQREKYCDSAFLIQTEAMLVSNIPD